MQTTFVRAAQENPAGPVTLAPARTTTQNLLKPKESLFKSRTTGNGNGDKSLVEALSMSKIFQEYERAFTEATGLPVLRDAATILDFAIAPASEHQFLWQSPLTDWINSWRVPGCI